MRTGYRTSALAQAATALLAVACQAVPPSDTPSASSAGPPPAQPSATLASAAPRPADGAASVAPMPVISFGVPAYASSGAPREANDRSYDTEWRSTEKTSPSTPSWLAYDLSSVPPSQRENVDVVWYNAEGAYADYDSFAQRGDSYNEPRDYVLQGNAAPGGAVPSSGWVALATVTGNTYVSRQHALALKGYNWLRIFVTAVNGSRLNENAALNLDVHDASKGLTDAWLFLGDSITSFAMRNDGAGIGAPSFAELVHAARAPYFPAAEGAGEGGWSSGTALSTKAPTGEGSLFDYWLSTFPGKFVCLSFGTNDGTDGSGDASRTYENFVAMVEKVTAAGKRPCIPHVPWAEDESHQKNAMLVNAMIDRIYQQYPQVVRGPDLWAALVNRKNLFQDNLHPNPQGRLACRRAWANAMETEVYGPASLGERRARSE